MYTCALLPSIAFVCGERWGGAVAHGQNQLLKGCQLGNVGSICTILGTLLNILPRAQACYRGVIVNSGLCLGKGGREGAGGFFQ